MPSTAAYPVHTLREHAAALEAAVTVCLAEQTPHAVHKVRTETRRVEAQLELLALLDGLPPYGPEARKLRRQLKKLRRAAGAVRDLDVRYELIEQSAHKQNPPGEDAASLHALRKRCRKDRKRAARKLLKVVAERQPKAVKALEALLDALEPAANLAVPVAHLVELLESHFASTHALALRAPSSEHLHTVRKAAKLARYMAENAPKASSAGRTARRFEAMQEAGGHWHDWLELADAAAQELGAKDPLTGAMQAKRDRRLAAYMGLLQIYTQRSPLEARAVPRPPTRRTVR